MNRQPSGPVPGYGALLLGHFGEKSQNYPCVSSRLLVPESKKNNVTLRAHYCAQSESTSKRLHKDTVTTVGGVDLALRARVVIQSTIDDKRIL